MRDSFGATRATLSPSPSTLSNVACKPAGHEPYLYLKLTNAGIDKSTSHSPVKSPQTVPDPAQKPSCKLLLLGADRPPSQGSREGVSRRPSP